MIDFTFLLFSFELAPRKIKLPELTLKRRNGSQRQYNTYTTNLRNKDLILDPNIGMLRFRLLPCI